jgi:branched-chain amino acid transport system permease protein
MDAIGLLTYGSHLAVFIAIYGLLALGLNVQWGFTGLFNAGIAGFFAVGAYGSAILTSAPAATRIGGFELPAPVGWLGGAVLAALIAWPVGKVCLRFRSDYLAIATIGVAEIMRLIARSEGWLTGAAAGISNLPRPFASGAFAGSREAALASNLAFLAMMLVLLGLSYWLIERQLRAPWGRMMRAIRDNETAARAMGKAIETRRLEAFMLGAALMGLGGAMFATFNRAITPDAIDPMVATFLVWIMLILGGSGNNRGALLGVAVVWVIWSMSELLTDRLPIEYAIQAKYLRVFLIGLALQLVLRFRPEGLLPEETARAPRER